jgi:hypothetical protein
MPELKSSAVNLRTSGYKASVVKIYNTTISLVRFEKNVFFDYLSKHCSLLKRCCKFRSYNTRIVKIYSALRFKKAKKSSAYFDF